MPFLESVMFSASVSFKPSLSWVWKGFIPYQESLILQEQLKQKAEKKATVFYWVLSARPQSLWV